MTIKRKNISKLPVTLFFHFAYFLAGKLKKIFVAPPTTPIVMKIGMVKTGLSPIDLFFCIEQKVYQKLGRARHQTKNVFWPIFSRVEADGYTPFAFEGGGWKLHNYGNIASKILRKIYVFLI